MPKPIDSSLPDAQVVPEQRLERRSRRQFSTDYKLRILAEAEQCKRGELGTLLLREKLYSNQLRDWRTQLAEGGAQALSKTAPVRLQSSPQSSASWRSYAARMRDSHANWRSLTGA